MKICSVDDCSGRHYAKNLCHRHYMRMKKTGNTSILRRENGTGTIHGGRLRVYKNHKPRRFYTIVVEEALGREIPKGAAVHHVDGNSLNDCPSNLVLCPDQGYHSLIERRTRAFNASGCADWMKCEYCKKYDDPVNLSFRTNQKGSIRGRHRKCHTDYENMRRAR